MGTTIAASEDRGLAGVLFTPVQERVLALLFGQPERRFRSSEIIRLADSGTGAVHRQLKRLAAAGLVTVEDEGNQRHYQARRDSAIFPELHGLVVKTAGLVSPLRAALQPFGDRIDAAFVYGSVARGEDGATSDIDLMIVGDGLEYSDVYATLQQAEEILAREVHPTILTPSEWRRKAGAGDSFAARVAGQPKRFVIGDEDALG